MKSKVVYLDRCDLELIQMVSPNAQHFLSHCQVLNEATADSFASVAIMFTPDRHTRRPLVTMLRDMVTYVADGGSNSELVCALIYRFLNFV